MATMREWKRRALLPMVVAGLAVSSLAWAADGGGGPSGFPLLSIVAVPGVNVPLGADSKLFPFAGGADIDATYRLPGFPLIFLGGELGYNYVATNAPSTSLSVANLGAQAGLHLQMNPILSGRLTVDGGYFLVAINQGGAQPNYNPISVAGSRWGWISPAR